MLSLRNISIRNKLIWMQVITSVVVLGLCFAVFVYTDITGYKERKLSSMVSIAQVIGANSISSFQFQDNERATMMLASLHDVEKDVINSAIFDSTGNLFANYSKDSNAIFRFQPPFKNSEVFSNDYLFVYRNIFRNNEFFGTVCLQVELSQLASIKNQKFRIAVILLIIGISLAFILAIINQRYISKPLLSLVNMIRNIRKSEDYNKHVPVLGKDEISVLSSEFNNLLDQVIKSNHKKDEFIGIATHELKTPLTSVKGYLELLNTMEVDPQSKPFIQKALKSTGKLQTLIFDLLDVSKIQAGQLQLDIREFDISELVEECSNEAKLTTTVHNIIYKNEMNDQTVIADRNRIGQVIINLLSNAIKYSPREKTILVNTRRDEANIIVSVKDFGIGLPISEQHKIFDRFYRSKEGKAGATGFGLGLYICSQIIRRHRGKIWVESEEGKGATFSFELPVENVRWN